MEIPRCENCGKIAQYKCAIDGNYVCCECARFMPVSKHHVVKPERPNIEIKVLEKMKQDPKERTILEALEDLTECPPPEKIDLETEWKPWPGYVYGHKEYNVKTMAIYANGEPVGYLDFLFTMDPEEDMSIQFWEMAIHPKFQSAGLFSALIRKLKQIAKENNVKKLYVSHENDNLPAIIAQYMLGGKILYVRESHEKETGRFGIPRRNDLIFQYDLEEEPM
ncbi:MAG: GNAT family N-acetyltransferase [Candidatus Hermodarchaeota archaeon]